MTTDSGAGAENQTSVEPVVRNGSRPVDVGQDEIDENAFAELLVQRAQGAGVSDAAELEEIREWEQKVLSRAEPARVGRTKVGPGERRRIVLQQHICILPEPDGRYVFE